MVLWQEPRADAMQPVRTYCLPMIVSFCAATLLVIAATVSGSPIAEAEYFVVHPRAIDALVSKGLQSSHTQRHTQPTAAVSQLQHSVPAWNSPQGLTPQHEQPSTLGGILHALVADWRVAGASFVTVALAAMVKALQTRRPDHSAPGFASERASYGVASHAFMMTSGAIRQPAPSAEDAVPWRSVLQVLAIQFSESFTYMLVVPLLPFMVRHFLPSIPAASVGYYSSSLISVLYLGQLLGSPLWGTFSDRIGRRPTMLLGLVGLLASGTMLAVSPSFGWALGARFAMGLLNGNTAVCKVRAFDTTLLSSAALTKHLLSPSPFAMLGPQINFVPNHINLLHI